MGEFIHHTPIMTEPTAVIAIKAAADSLWSWFDEALRPIRKSFALPSTPPRHVTPPQRNPETRAAIVPGQRPVG